MQLLPPLRPGDTIALIAPGSANDAQRMEEARALLTKLGYRVKISAQCLASFGQFAGTDDARVTALHEAFADPDVTAIICARGGYGAPRLLDKIDFDALRAAPKIFVGYSDITCLLNTIAQRCGFATFHGPMALDLTADNLAAAENLLTFLSGKTQEIARYAPASADILRPGSVEAPVFGGNLCLIETVTGTPFMPCLTDAIFLMEEIDEALYRIDRTLTHLRLAGSLTGLRGVLCGSLTGTTHPTRAFGKTDDAVLAEHFLPATDGPVLANAPFGHSKPNLVLPLGARVKFDVRTEEIALTLQESIFAS